MQIHYNDRREAMCNFYEDYVEKRPGREQWGDDDERRQSKEALHVLLLASSILESNAGPERFFSRVTKSSRGRRSTIKCETLEALIRVQELGKASDEVNFDLPNSKQIRNRVTITCLFMHSLTNFATDSMP